MRKELNRRESQVLLALVREYLGGSGPVGSRTLAENWDLGCSPATIRSAMSSLAEKGYLVQPHTSAGRIPTHEAYRFFVERIREPGSLPEDLRQRVEERLYESLGELDDLLLATSSLLSDLSSCAGVALSPRLSDAVFRNLDFVRLGAGRILAIFIAQNGWVKKRILRIEEEIEQEELERISRYLRAEFQGLALPEIRRRILERMQQEKALYDRLVSRALQLGRETFEQESAPDLYLGQLHNLMAFPEFASTGRLRELYQAFEEKSRIVMLLDRCLEGEDLQVRIGLRDEALEMPELALVAAPYSIRGRPRGMVGVFGPDRMPYPLIMSLVDYTARVLSSLLSPIDTSESPRRGEE